MPKGVFSSKIGVQDGANGAGMDIESGNGKSKRKTTSGNLLEVLFKENTEVLEPFRN